MKAGIDQAIEYYKKRDKNHSPLPWKHAIKIGVSAMQNVRDADGFILASCTTIENAEFIVRCCNSHDALVSALQSCLDLLRDPDTSEFDANDTEQKIVAALALAKGE